MALTSRDQSFLCTLIRDYSTTRNGHERESKSYRAVTIGRVHLIDTPDTNPESFFHDLGYVVVDSVDINNAEGSNIIHDMNTPILLDDGQEYDLVFDNGTMEHCFNPCQFILNVHELTTVNGLVIHSNPVHNYVNHGFFTFSPCFYLAFYLLNAYEILELTFTGIRKVRKSSLTIYEPVFQRRVKGNSILHLLKSPRVIIECVPDAEVMVTLTTVVKKKYSLNARIPQQPIYSESFRSFPSAPVLRLL